MCILIFTQTSVCVQFRRKHRPEKIVFCLNMVRTRYLEMPLLPCSYPDKHSCQASFNKRNCQVFQCSSSSAREQGLRTLLSARPWVGALFCSATLCAWLSAWFGGLFLNGGLHHQSYLKTHFLLLFVLSTNEHIHWNRHLAPWSEILTLRKTKMTNIFVTYNSLSIFI